MNHVKYSQHAVTTTEESRAHPPTSTARSRVCRENTLAEGPQRPATQVHMRLAQPPSLRLPLRKHHPVLGTAEGPSALNLTPGSAT